MTKKEAYPLPRMDDALNAVDEAKYFTTLDLRWSGHWEVALEEK